MLISDLQIIDPHNYLLITIDGQLLRGLFEHERLKPAMIKTDKVNVSTLPALKSNIHVYTLLIDNEPVNIYIKSEL